MHVAPRIFSVGARSGTRGGTRGGSRGGTSGGTNGGLQLCIVQVVSK